MATKQEQLKFKHRCVVNFENVDFDMPVYRVFPIDRVLDLFKDKKNTLVKPVMWDDPFENVLFQHNLYLYNGQVVNLDELKEKYYGQCWTLNTEETDALWRIYSPKKNGVRVKTTLKKLWDSYYNPNHPEAMISFYIGKITYASADEIQKFLEEPGNINSILYDGSGVSSAATLLIKRTEFTHENEVRLIYHANPSKDDLKKPIYQYTIEPNHLIEELLFDPRFDETIYKNKIAELKAMGYSNIIDKSKLYQLPKFNLRLKNK